MSEAHEQMPVEIWTDINGNATRTQFKRGVKYIRADELDRLRDELDVYRQAVQYVFEAINKFENIQRKKAALTPAGGGKDGLSSIPK